MPEQAGDSKPPLLKVLHGPGRAENMGTMPPGFRVVALPELQIVNPDIPHNRGGFWERLRQRPPVTVALLKGTTAVFIQEASVKKVSGVVDDFIDSANNLPDNIGQPTDNPRPTAS